MALEELVEGGGIRAELEPVQRNRVRVLLAPERQLGFFLADVLLVPRRQNLGHADAQQGNNDQQDGHGVARLV